MNAKEKNRWYWKSLDKFDCLRAFLHNKTNWFTLPWITRDLIEKLAEAWNVKPQTNGWTTGHTLYNRAIKGRPF